MFVFCWVTANLGKNRQSRKQKNAWGRDRQSRKQKKTYMGGKQQKTTWYLIGHIKFPLHVYLHVDVQVRVPINALEIRTADPREHESGGVHSTQALLKRA